MVVDVLGLKRLVALQAFVNNVTSKPIPKFGTCSRSNVNDSMSANEPWKRCDTGSELDNQDSMTLFDPTFNEELENLKNYVFIVVMVRTSMLEK